MIRSSALVLALVAGLALPAAGLMAQQPPAGARAQAADAELLPFSRITLYRSGVGAFERQGLVQDAASVQLRFDVTQINDILKSLQLLDLDGGRVDSVSYASKDPLNRRLNSFSVPIGDAPTIPQLLGRLRGARIAVETFDRKVEGTILGVETRKLPGGKDSGPVETPFLTLVTQSGVQAVAIDSFKSFELKDPGLADELNKALGAVADTRGERVKTVDLALSGAGARRVVVRYVHETPVWKTSYRLLIPDATAKPAPTSPTLTLQGWAIVENTTDNDWKNVKLALVSGRPVSFQMDLAEPLYVARPEVPVPFLAGVMPRQYEGGVFLGREPTARSAPAAPALAAMEAAGLADGRMDKAGRPGRVGGRGTPGSGIAPGSPSMGEGGIQYGAEDLANYAPAAAARAGQVGEVFFFEVENPVTIERQRSAMIPFLTAGVAGRRVSIYNHQDRADHPMRGVEITNSSDTQLLPGPIAVFDGTAYAGDAQIGQVSKGDKRLLAYAVDLDVQVISKFDGQADTTKVRIIDGVFELTTKVRNDAVFDFSNKDLKQSRTLIVEHPKLAGWNLADGLKPKEETQDLYRFEIEIEPGKAGKLAVGQERIEVQRAGLTDYNLDQVLAWHKNGRLSDGVLAAVRELGKRQGEIRDAERALQLTDQSIATNTSEQTRVSQTMERLPQNAELYNDYMKELKQLTDTLRTLRTQRADQSNKLETLRAQLNEWLRTLKAE